MRLSRLARRRVKARLAGVVLGAALVWPVALFARANLPQIQGQVELSAATAAAARDFFRGSAHGAAIPDALQQQLIRGLPPVLAPACKELVGLWGTEARSTEYWSIRVLELKPPQVWLAFRCNSRLPVYLDAYDERLALLDLPGGRLEFVPTGPNLDNDSTLYHLEFSGYLPLPEGDGAAFQVATTTDNPCCGGGDLEEDERVEVFTPAPSGPREALNVVVGRHTTNHDDENGDSETNYKAELQFERDSVGGIVQVTADYREQSRDYDLDGKLRAVQPAPRLGKEVFRWDAASRRFVKANK